MGQFLQFQEVVRELRLTYHFVMLMHVKHLLKTVTNGRYFTPFP